MNYWLLWKMLRDQVQQDLVERFIDRFLPLAALVVHLGMIPLFPPLQPGGDYWDLTFLKQALDLVVAEAGTGVVHGEVHPAVEARDGHVDAAAGVVVTDGHRLRNVLQEWTIRHLAGEMPGYFSNARVVVLGGRNHYRTTRVLSESTQNLRFADPAVEYGLDNIHTPFEVFERVVSASGWLLHRFPSSVVSTATAPARQIIEMLNREHGYGLPVNEFADEISNAIRRVLGLTGPASPGWFRLSALSQAQLDSIVLETSPIIAAFAARSTP